MRTLISTPLPMLIFVAMLAVIAILVCCGAVPPPGGDEVDTALIALYILVFGILTLICILRALRARKWWIQ